VLVDQNELLSIIVNGLPSGNPMKNFDLSTESNAITFIWRGDKYRVSCDLHVDEVDGQLLRHGSCATLMEQLLKLTRNLGLHK
jgi:hypothetical protein